MKSILHLLTVLGLVVVPALAGAQGGVTIINHYSGDTTGRGTAGFELTHSGEHKVIVNYYEPAGTVQLNRLEAVVGAALDYYLDQHIELKNDRIALKKNKKQMLGDMEDIVTSAVKFYEYRELSEFEGFSAQVSDELDRLDNLGFDESGYAKLDASPGEKKQLEQHFFRASVIGLKELANKEVGNYSSNNLLVYAGSEETTIDEATRELLLSEMNAPFDPESPLDYIPIHFTNETLNMLSMRDHSVLPDEKPDNSELTDFENRVLGILESNDRKLDSMQGEIDELRAEQLRLWKEKQDETNNELQVQINDLRGMVVDLVRIYNPAALASSEGTVNAPRPTIDSDLTNLPKSISIHFQKGSVQLDAVSRLSLNEMLEILVHNPSLQVMITGYADKSGSDMQNLLLSQERAKAVKKFFVSSGLPDNRFIVRYFGSRDSTIDSPDDRKVVLEFIR